jgi:hypothetical protein
LLHAIISKQVKLEKSGRDWKGLCPFHSERTPSFTVYDDGHYHCFGCNEHGTTFDYVMKTEHIGFREAVARIEAELGLAPAQSKKPNGSGAALGNGAGHGDVWQPTIPPPADAPKPDPSTKHQKPKVGPIVGKPYDYHGTDGGLIFQVTRHAPTPDEPKPFRQRRPDGKGGWIGNLDGVERVLYRLPSLLAAPKSTMRYLCEGEKDADRLAEHLLVATTNPMGAGNFKAEQARYLAGCDVALLIDNDEAGEKRAVEVPKLLAGIARSVRIIRLPGLGHGEDVSNWLDRGGTADELERLVRETPEYRPADAPRPKGGRILSGAAFIARHIPPVWLVDGIVQRSRLYACTSLTGHGKTAVWSFNACMIHTGRMIGQLNVFQGNVLILAGENPSDLEARMIGMAKAYNLRHDQLPYVLPGGFPLTEEEADALKRDIAGLGVPLALIVGDTASSFFPGDDENSNVQAGTYARTLRTFTIDCDGYPAVVALCHPTKNASRGNLLPRGGGAFLNELDGNLSLWSETPGEVTELHWCGKIRGPDFSPFGYRLRPVPTGLTDERSRPEMTIVAEPMSEEAIADHSKQTLANEDAVLRMLRDHPGWSWAQIARETGWIDGDDKPERWRVQRALASLAEDRLIQRPRKGAQWTLTDKGEEVIGQPAGTSSRASKAAEPTKTAKPEPHPPPTEAEIDAEINRHNALPEKLRPADLKLAAKRLSMTAAAFERLAKAQEEKPTKAGAPEPPLPPAPPTEAEIDAEIARIAAMSDAAFLALDRTALAAWLHCTSSELRDMRRRAQTAPRAKTQEVEPAQGETAKHRKGAAKAIIVAKAIIAKAAKPHGQRPPR